MEAINILEYMFLGMLILIVIQTIIYVIENWGKRTNEKRFKNVTDKDMLIAIISLYVSGTINFNKLENWYVPRLETLVHNPETSNIIARLELELAELQDGLQTEEDLKNNLKTMLKEDF